MVSSLTKLYKVPAISGRKYSHYSWKYTMSWYLVSSPHPPISVLEKLHTWKVKRYQQHCTKGEGKTCQHYCDIYRIFFVYFVFAQDCRQLFNFSRNRRKEQFYMLIWFGQFETEHSFKNIFYLYKQYWRIAYHEQTVTINHTYLWK